MIIKDNISLIYQIPSSVEGGKEEAFRLIKDYKKRFISYRGLNFFKLILLNYRSHFTPNKKEKVLKLFRELILNDNKKYTANIAICLNILKNFKLDENEKEILYQYLQRYFDKKIPKTLLIPISKEKIKR